MTAELDRAVKTVVRQCMGISPGEEVLVVCNPVTEEIGALMRIEAQGEGADATLAVISERESAAAEPPRPVAAAMAAADVVLAPTIQSLSHTAARKAASEAGVRIGTLPGVTEEMLGRLMTGDLEEIRRRGWAIVTALNRGSQVRITCSNGSDLRIGLEGRQGIVDAGELGNRGAFGNLPCGEGFIAPLEGTTEGTLVVDGSIAEIGLLETSVALTVREGHLVEASGEDGARLMELLTVHGKDGTNVAELGIGTNEEAILTGNILEDEKILGTCHVAFGASAAIGGTVQVPVHLDCVVLEPTVEIDGETIVSGGDLLV
ncbi:MAG TPA: aminopeptidase [Solirubrobacterales bacterium]|jgi:leucyl aminopeptidase (aminopeptidase T)|nr:aminopeptidase [Solirubrobacterales bacterium]